MKGKRHLTGLEHQRREAAEKARMFRLNFLRNLKPGHPLYASADARAARGEREEHSGAHRPGSQGLMVNGQIHNGQPNSQ